MKLLKNVSEWSWEIIKIKKIKITFNPYSINGELKAIMFNIFLCIHFWLPAK